MNYTTIITTIALITAASSLFAESVFERELIQLTEQHEKAVTTATEPINRLYRTALEQLLRQATQSEDSATAAKIKSIIASLQSGAQRPKSKPKTAGELKDFLAGTVWNISDENPDGKVLYTLTFLKNGTFIHSNGRSGAWTALSARDLKLWNWDPATLNEELTQFRAVGTGVIYFGNLKK